MSPYSTTTRSTRKNRIESLPIPSRKDENYRFTSLSNFNLQQLNPSIAHPPKTVEPAPEGFQLAACTYPGGLAIALESSSHEGLHLSPFEDAPEAIFQKHRAAFDLPQALDADLFANLSAGRCENELLIHVTEGKKITQPLFLRNFFPSTDQAFYSRTLIILEANAELELAQEFVWDGIESLIQPFACGLTQIVLGPGATLRFSTVQNWNPNTEHFSRTYSVLQEGSQLTLNEVHLGGLKNQTRHLTHFEGRNSQSLHTVTALAQNSQQMDFWIDAVHQGVGSRSDVEVRSIAQDKGQIVFNGKIRIEPTAPQTAAYQKNPCLILSEGAVIRTLPKLEIQTDDVQCAHGASISSVDEDQLYYLASRGIPENTARTMLIEAFKAPGLRGVSNPFTKSWLSKNLALTEEEQ